MCEYSLTISSVTFILSAYFVVSEGKGGFARCRHGAGTEGDADAMAEVTVVPTARSSYDTGSSYEQEPHAQQDSWSDEDSWDDEESWEDEDAWEDDEAPVQQGAEGYSSGEVSAIAAVETS